jgi:hypothetical protein
VVSWHGAAMAQTAATAGGGSASAGPGCPLRALPTSAARWPPPPAPMPSCL